MESRPAELTPAELTVLGLVVEQPCHGYDLEHKIERRGIRRWTDIGFSSIYYLLDKLEKRDLVRARPADRGGRAKRVFEATKAGQEVAKNEAIAFIADARPAPRPILVGLANLELLSDADYTAALRVRLDHLDHQIEAVIAARDAADEVPQSAGEVFSYSLAMLSAERSWLQARLADGEPWP